MCLEVRMVSFCKYLREVRIKSGISQWQVAQKLGYSTPQFVSNWERNKCLPPIESFRILSHLYQIPFDAFVDMFVQEQRKAIYKKNRMRNKVPRSATTEI